MRVPVMNSMRCDGCSRRYVRLPLPCGAHPVRDSSSISQVVRASAPSPCGRGLGRGCGFRMISHLRKCLTLDRYLRLPLCGEDAAYAADVSTSCWRREASPVERSSHFSFAGPRTRSCACVSKQRKVTRPSAEGRKPAAPRGSLRSQASQFAITNDQRAGRLYRMPNMKTGAKGYRALGALLQEKQRGGVTNQ